jgi:uncharacterized protein (TIGR03066 family)
LRLLILTVMLALAVAIPGGLASGQEDKEKDKSNNKGKIEGTKWSSIEATVNGTKIAAGALKMEFGKDGKFVYDIPTGKVSGTYELGDGDKVTLKFEKELAGKKTHVETITLKDNKLTMTDSDGTSLTFEKTK